jgi:hypothetical protein
MRFALRLALCLSLLVVPSLALADDPQPAAAKVAYQCPSGLESRTPTQVWADRLAAISVGDLDRVMCDYADDAVLVTAGGVASGAAAIRASLEGLLGLLGGNVPTVSTVTIEGKIIFITWFVTSPVVSIPDGSDTFVIKHGKIQYQTAHAPMVFNAPPPAPATAAP